MSDRYAGNVSTKDDTLSIAVVNVSGDGDVGGGRDCDDDCSANDINLRNDLRP